MESQKKEFAQGPTARNRQGGSLSCSESQHSELYSVIILVHLVHIKHFEVQRKHIYCFGRSQRYNLKSSCRTNLSYMLKLGRQNCSHCFRLFETVCSITGSLETCSLPSKSVLLKMEEQVIVQRTLLPLNSAIKTKPTMN